MYELLLHFITVLKSQKQKIKNFKDSFPLLRRLLLENYISK